MGDKDPIRASRKLYPNGPTAKPKALKVKNTFHVSHSADELIQDFEQAYQRMLKAETDEEITDAYTALNQRRRDLYEHIHDMERLLDRSRPVTKRF